MAGGEVEGGVGGIGEDRGEGSREGKRKGVETNLLVPRKPDLLDVSELGEVSLHLGLVESVRDSSKVQNTLLLVL